MLKGFETKMAWQIARNMAGSTKANYKAAVSQVLQKKAICKLGMGIRSTLKHGSTECLQYKGTRVFKSAVMATCMGEFSLEGYAEYTGRTIEDVKAELKSKKAKIAKAKRIRRKIIGGLEKLENNIAYCTEGTGATEEEVQEMYAKR